MSCGTRRGRRGQFTRVTETDEETIKACLVTVPRPAVSGLVCAGSRMIPALSWVLWGNREKEEA